ncbi:MAG: hypothetical protein JW775_03060, partial [Candidatus Aminicenantes bacterium]|nr:hypothetical protein [Candidatus Aminicenantes bacterium]
MEPQDIARVGELFQEFTKYRHFTAPSLMVRGAPMPGAEKPVPPGAVIVDLPAPPGIHHGQARGFFDILRTRRSRRDYDPEPLALKDLAAL